jgi:hypothetical protein
VRRFVASGPFAVRSFCRLARSVGAFVSLSHPSRFSFVPRVRLARSLPFCRPADRRPSSNADPYLVTGKIMATIMEDVDVPEIAALNKEN